MKITIKHIRSIFSKLIIIAVVATMTLTGCATSGGTTAATTTTTAAVSSTPSTDWQWGDQLWAEAVKAQVSGKTLKIGFTPPAASEFYDIIMHGAYTMMNEIHARFGVNFEFEFVAPAEHNAVEAQVATIEDWVTKKFDVIMVCTAGDFESMNAVYEKAEAAGTAIYLFNMPAELWDTDSIKATTVIGYNNNIQSGYIIGQYAAEKLNGEGEILFISGNDGHWTTSRSNGFLKAIAEYPGLTIVGTQRGEYVREKGMTAAENMLQANPNVKFIYGENEEMAQGAVQAIKAMGLKLWDGTDGIIVVGADGLMSGYEQIEKNGLTATVDVGSVDQGRECIKAIFMHELLGYTIDKIVNVPTILVDSSNVKVPKAYVAWALSAKEEYK